MKLTNLSLSLLLFTAFFSSSVLAVQPVDLVKVKRGIMPNGGFYSIFDVSCSNEKSVQIAETDRRTRWCALSGNSAYNCFRTPKEAAEQACMGSSLLLSNASGVQQAGS
jgi:hypothetical protein